MSFAVLWYVRAILNFISEIRYFSNFILKLKASVSLTVWCFQSKRKENRMFVCLTVLYNTCWAHCCLSNVFWMVHKWCRWWWSWQMRLDWCDWPWWLVQQVNGRTGSFLSGQSEGARRDGLASSIALSAGFIRCARLHGMGTPHAMVLSSLGFNQGIGWWAWGAVLGWWGWGLMMWWSCWGRVDWRWRQHSPYYADRLYSVCSAKGVRQGTVIDPILVGAWKTWALQYKEQFLLHLKCDEWAVQLDFSVYANHEGPQTYFLNGLVSVLV